MYLRLFDDGLEFEENLKGAVFAKRPLLYDEDYFLLREELREPSTYLALLKYLAAGYNTIGKLASAVGADKANLTKYLAVLQGLVKHVVPYGQRRKGIYAVADNYMWFWLRFVPPTSRSWSWGTRTRCSAG